MGDMDLSKYKDIEIVLTFILKEWILSSHSFLSCRGKAINTQTRQTINKHYIIMTIPVHAKSKIGTKFFI